jgi:hypothetical protein
MCTDGVLRQLAQEVLEVIKSVVGNDVFSQQYAAAHQSLSERRGSRKLQRAQQVSRALKWTCRIYRVISVLYEILWRLLIVIVQKIFSCVLGCYTTRSCSKTENQKTRRFKRSKETKIGRFTTNA